jgi:hypothetical protein
MEILPLFQKGGVHFEVVVVVEVVVVCVCVCVDG